MSAGKWVCTVNELATAVTGQIRSKGPGSFVRVGTDTRANLKGRLYVALKGDHFDGHDFVAKAVEAGASAVLVHKWREEWTALLSQAAFVQVDDTLQALQAFGLFWRRKHAFQIFAVTGSNGKTSAKEFALSLMSKHFKVHASKGSFNNHWGVPLSILDASPEHTHVILEMGMNHSGEISHLCSIAEPNVTMVTTVGRAHIGQLGTQADVAQAKEEIYVASPQATHIFNMDNEWTMRMQTRSHSKQILFSSFNVKSDVHLRAQRISWSGMDILGTIGGEPGQVMVSVIGRHNVVNLMSAASFALAAGMRPSDIWRGLGEIRSVNWGRNQMLKLTNGASLIFDAYNSNPDSMQALIKYLYEMEIEGRKFLIMGDMRELGSHADQLHEEIGQRAASVAFNAVWYVGDHAGAFWRGYESVRKPEIAFTSARVESGISAKFLALLKSGDFLAIKGSRGMELEKVLVDWPLTTPLGSKP